MRALLFVAALLVAAPVAIAQHDMMGGEGMAVVLHDGPDSGRAVVGSITHFGFALLDAKGAPVVHQNAAFLVVEDNVTVFQTNDTHEYDGIFSLDYMFSHPGHYRVEAMSGKMAMGVFEGDAVSPVNATVAKVVIKMVEAGMSANAADLTVDIQDPQGATIPHTDALLEWRDAATGLLVARTHAHIHEKPIVLAQGFDLPGRYALQVTAFKSFATGHATDVAAVVGSSTFDAGPLALPATPDPAAFPPATLSPQGVSATKGGLSLQGMYDPQNQVIMGFPIRLSGLVEGPSHMPKPHVDFTFALHGPHGLVFESASLHEYDGHFEYLDAPQLPGAYDGLLTADDGADKVSVPFHFRVLPPSAPASLASGPGGSAGVGFVDVAGLDKLVAGAPATLTFSASNPAGAIEHSEVDVTIAPSGKPALYNFKLHTHESGLTHATVVFPTEGDYTINVDPVPTDTGLVAFQGPAGPGMAVQFHARVSPGPLHADAMAAAHPAGRATPDFALPLAASGIALAALLVRRRR